MGNFFVFKKAYRDMKNYLNKKKKIIFSNYDDIKNPFYGGGGAYVVHELAKRLTQEFDVTVVTGKYPGSKNEMIDRVKYERIGLEKVGPKLSQFVFYFMLFFYFKSKKFDIWMENFTPPFSTNFLQLFTKKPVVGLVYMLVGEDMRRKYKLPFDFIEKMGIKTYKYFITPTESAKEKILQINPSATVNFIPNGIIIKKVGSKNDKKTGNILYIGRIEINQKGLDLLLKAFSGIINETDCGLLIAGSGAPGDLKMLNKLIEDLGIKNRVRLLGKVTGKAKEELYVNSIFTVIPSRFETFSMVALESLAYGSPIISFDIDGLRWIPKGSIVKVRPFDEKALAEAMLSLIKDSTQREKMKLIGTKYALANTWEKIVKSYKDYIGLIEQSRI